MVNVIHENQLNRFHKEFGARPYIVVYNRKFYSRLRTLHVSNQENNLNNYNILSNNNRTSINNGDTNNINLNLAVNHCNKITKNKNDVIKKKRIREKIKRHIQSQKKNLDLKQKEDLKYEKVIENFLLEKKKGPTYVCVCCDGLFFSRTVKKFNQQYAKTKLTVSQYSIAIYSLENVCEGNYNFYYYFLNSI